MLRRRKHPKHRSLATAAVGAPDGRRGSRQRRRTWRRARYFEDDGTTATWGIEAGAPGTVRHREGHHQGKRVAASFRVFVVLMLSHAPQSRDAVIVEACPEPLCSRAGVWARAYEGE